MSVTKEQVVEFISNMTVLELSEFINELEEKFGVSAAATAVVAGPAAGAAAPAAEEKTEFDVVLKSFDAAAKLKVLKLVREVCGLGLKEAKDVVDGAPKVVKEGASKEEAEDIKKKLEEVGAKVTLK